MDLVCCCFLATNLFFVFLFVQFPVFIMRWFICPADRALGLASLSISSLAIGPRLVARPALSQSARLGRGGEVNERGYFLLLLGDGQLVPAGGGDVIFAKFF